MVFSVFMACQVNDGEVGAGVILLDEQGDVSFFVFVVGNDGKRHVAVLNSSSDFHAIFSFVVLTSY